MKQIGSREARKELEARGWKEARRKGRHVTFTKPGVPRIITILEPCKSLSPGIVKMIETNAGFKF